MSLVFDTTILIEKERGNKRILQQLEILEEQQQEDPVITIFTYAEFYFGLLRYEKQKMENELSLLNAFSILHTTKESAQRFALLRHALKRAGKEGGVIDLFIAAITIEAGKTLVSMDKSFRQIPGLSVIILE